MAKLLFICVITSILILDAITVSLNSFQEDVSGDGSKNAFGDGEDENGNEALKRGSQGKTSNKKISVLDMVLNAKSLVRITAKDLLSGKQKLPNLRKLEIDVVDGGHIYFIDFIASNDNDKRRLTEMCLSKLAVDFSCEALIVSSYNDTILFSPIKDMKHPDLVDLLSSDVKKKFMKLPTLPKRVNKEGSRRSGANRDVPYITFLLDIEYEIPPKSCIFGTSPNGFTDTRSYLCDKPSIALFFRVNCYRSLPFQTSGDQTPDVKIVRISTNENSAGVGIHLNEELKLIDTTYNPDEPWDGWLADYVTSAIASDYTIEVTALNNKASILKKVPQQNVNRKTEFSDTSSMTVGISGGAEVNKEGPKATVSANAAWTDSRQVRFSTEDYKLRVSTASPQNVKFQMIRETYPKADDLVKTRTTYPRFFHNFFHEQYPADLSRVHPIGYASYTQQMDVIYEAASDAIGTTAFHVTASVGIMPLYHTCYHHYFVLGNWLTYKGLNRDGRQVGVRKRMTINWNHPVFLGGWPVNLQSKAYVNKCLEVSNDGSILLANGDFQSDEQSFIFDKYARYVSVISAHNTPMCLDGADLSILKRCSSRLTQRWRWEGDHLINLYTEKSLGYDTSKRIFAFYNVSNHAEYTKMISTKTDLF